MFVTLIATVAAGFLGAGCVLLLRFVMRRFGVEDRLPRWATPVAAGGFMLAATISSEYAWFSNSEANLPDGVEVIATREHQAAWQPWTYLRPFVSSFVALDVESVRTNATDEGLKIVDLYVFTRWRPTQQLQVAVDCGQSLVADPADGVQMDGEGRPAGVVWREVTSDDPILSSTCS